MRIHSYERLPHVKPGVGQSTALHALPTAQNSALIDVACPVNPPPPQKKKKKKSVHNNTEIKHNLTCSTNTVTVNHTFTCDLRDGAHFSVDWTLKMASHTLPLK